MKTSKKKAAAPPVPVSTEEFDRKFEAGEDVSEHLDWSKATKFVNIELPLWMVKAIDQESDAIGIARQAQMKVWLAEKLKALGHSAPDALGQDGKPARVG
jgi:hypothetical protein